MSPISIDLRKRIIACWQEEKQSPEVLAKRFAVGSATVKRLIARFRITGSVEPMPHGGGQKPKIPLEKLPRVRRLVEANPDWTIEEILDAYNCEQGTTISRSTMDRAVRRLGFTRKKSRSLPRNVTPHALRPGAKASPKPPRQSPLRVWFLWTKPARTSR